MKVQLILIASLSFLFSCSIEKEPLNYGEDQCHFCKMTIVDKIHGAEIVTTKGKIFKFDAVECMVNYSADFDASKVAMFLTNHYENPEELIDATKAFYLISEELPSPMGANLTAFPTVESVETGLSKYPGKKFSWLELNDRFNKR